jgi:hypothetical protein
MSDINQPTVILTTDTTEEIAAGGTVSFPFVPALTADDLLADQTVYLTAYSREFPDLAVTITETSADVTWPADAPYPLPIGEYNCEFQTTYVKEGEGGGLPPGLSQVAAQPVVTLVAQAVDDPATVDLVTLATAYNTAVAAHDELATKYNGLLAAMQASGVMAPSAVATKSKKARK